MSSVVTRATGLGAGIGGTPLVPIQLDELPPGVTLLAKLESANPGGSIKDRPVQGMIRGALQRGDLGSGRRLLDSSSGNAGIAYAMLGAALGVPVTLVVPGNASTERIQRIRAHGAELVLTDPLEGYDFAVAEAQRLAREHPQRYWYSDQYGNEDNWRAHYDGTAVELIEQWPQPGGAPDLFVCGIGTGGTLTGMGRRLRRARPDVTLAVVLPEVFPGIEGLKPLGQPGDLVPGILDEGLVDLRVPVSLDEALAMCRRLAARGLFVGPSSGANVHAACQLAAEGSGHRAIATVLCDTGERYVSTGMWGEASTGC